MVSSHNNDSLQKPKPSLQKRMTAKFESPAEAEKLQRQSTTHSATFGAAGEHVMELEWEEWDGSGSFVDHCLAGSFAGVMEHTLLYPVDTLRTNIQAYCADCPQKPTCEASNVAKSVATESSPSGMLSTMRQLTSEKVVENGTVVVKENAAGFGRLWRGVQTMMVGCIPAHALYFSSYEAIKALFLKGDDQNLGPLGSAVAGAAAAFCHDVIMTPADTVKQRLQLGHYNGMTDAVQSILGTEGPAGLYRSFPITLLTNLPYGMIMVTTNEYLREVLTKRSNSPVLDVKTTILAGCGAGMVAAAVTTPLDRVKTRLQTQGLSTVLNNTAGPASCDGIPADCPKVQAAEEAMLSVKPKYQGLQDAFKSIVREEGWMGLFRGMTPRLMTHTPAIAISWTTYEAAKMYLMS